VLRPGDTAARFGGDEFTVLCEEIVGPADAVAIAERILAVVARPFQLEDAEVYLSTSVGIALATSPDDRPESLVRDADAAMYQAKQRGKARWVLFDEDMRASAVARLEVENGLHRALDREELRIRYQPVVQPATGVVVALEARAWWDSANLGLLSPDEWQPLAEEVGLAVPIGTWVLQAACRQAATWAGDVAVGIDLSARQLAQPDTAAVVADALKAAGLPPRRLCVEVTEDALLVDQEHAVACLTQLRETGVRVVLDRFGSGHSSLVQLREFPLDALKIDRAFVDDATVTAALVRLAHSLGLQAVVEGVDTDEQRKVAESVGCDGAQGAAFGEPIPAEEVGALLL
jgi:predicted signal transduction protein with EAL and GGDEF domain